MIDLPPPLWDAAAPPGMVEVQRPIAEVGKVCRALGLKSHGVVYGCSLWANGGCLIVIPSDPALAAAARKHETAHCNGWPADHPR